MNTVDEPDTDHPLWDKIWSTAKCETGVMLTKSPSTSFIPYQCCPVVDCHFGPKKDRHPTQQPNGYRQDRFLKHWQAAHQFESWYAICRNCCHVGRWRDEIKNHIAKHANTDHDYADFKLPSEPTKKKRPVIPVKNKHVVIMRLNVTKFDERTYTRFCKEPYVDPQSLVVENIKDVLPNINTPIYSHWTVAGFDEKSFTDKVVDDHSGEWWLKGTSRYHTAPKCPTGVSSFDWNTRSEIHRLKTRIRSRQKRAQRRRKAIPSTSGRPTSTEPPVKRSKQDSDRSDEEDDPFEDVLTKDKRKIRQLEREVEQLKEGRDRSSSQRTGSNTSARGPISWWPK